MLPNIIYLLDKCLELNDPVCSNFAAVELNLCDTKICWLRFILVPILLASCLELTLKQTIHYVYIQIVFLNSYVILPTSTGRVNRRCALILINLSPCVSCVDFFSTTVVVLQFASSKSFSFIVSTLCDILVTLSFCLLECIVSVVLSML